MWNFKNIRIFSLMAYIAKIYGLAPYGVRKRLRKHKYVEDGFSGVVTPVGSREGYGDHRAKLP